MTTKVAAFIVIVLTIAVAGAVGTYFQVLPPMN